MLPKVYMYQMPLGCDPEFFFEQKAKATTAADGVSKKKIIGSEHVIAKNGKLSNSYGKFVIDGVQAELNPNPSVCRVSLAHGLRYCFKMLADEMKKHPDITVNFDQSVKITKAELKKLDKEHQKLGCSPSFNSYEDTSTKLKAIDPLNHTQRSAGGHIHIGTGGFSHLTQAIKTDPKTMVKMLDIICGNTCVLIDRDKGNVERRKLYGWAGEYRLPKHGIEYRTLSNFWLRNYHLMSFAFGMARLAVQLASDPNNSAQFTKAFLGAVDIEKVREAINTNNYTLAYENFKAIEPLLNEVTSNTGHHPLHTEVMKDFHYFIAKIDEKGLDYWFEKDVLNHWSTIFNKNESGAQYFLSCQVREDREKEERKSKAVAAKDVTNKASSRTIPDGTTIVNGNNDVVAPAVSVVPMSPIAAAAALVAQTTRTVKVPGGTVTSVS